MSWQDYPRVRASSAVARRSIELSHRRVLVSNSLLKRLQQLNSSTSAAIFGSSVQLPLIGGRMRTIYSSRFTTQRPNGVLANGAGLTVPGASQQIQRFRATIDSLESCAQTNRKKRPKRDAQGCSSRTSQAWRSRDFVADVSAWRAEPMAIASKSRND
jgi:hypothetical protein